MGIGDVGAKLRQLDIIFVIDTTGSMASSIGEVQRRLKDFADALATADLRPDVAFGVVAYRDHPPEDSSYVTLVSPPTSSLEKAQASVDALRAEGGGDGPEAVLDGLDAALNGAQPRAYAHRVIVLIGDAPPHGMGGEEDRWPEGCPCGLETAKITAQAQARAVTIYAVGVGADPAMSSSFREIAEATDGNFVPLQMVEALIPRILELLQEELGKMAADGDVFGAWTTLDDRSPAALASALGWSVSEVEASLKRLKAKGVLDVDALDQGTLLRVLRGIAGGESGASEPMAAVEPELLDLIRIDDGSYTIASDSGEFEIRFLDE